MSMKRFFDRLFAREGTRNVDRFGPSEAVGLGVPSWVENLWHAGDLSLSEADPVATWSPRKGAVNLVQATAGLRPIYRADLVPNVEFVPTDFLTAALGTIAQPNTHFVILKLDGSGVVQGFTDGDTNGVRNHLWRENPNQWALYAGTIGNGAVASDTVLHLLGGTFNGAASVIRVDGGKETVNAGTESCSNLIVGANVNQAFGMDGRLYAVGTAALAPTDGQWAELRAYCTQEFGTP